MCFTKCLSKLLFLNLGTCHIQNGNCGGLCVPEENGRRCECDIGLQLQPDQSCDSGGYSFIKPYIGLRWFIKTS